MHVIEPQQNLLCNLLNEGHGHAFRLVSADEAEEVFAEDFENHADVGAVGPAMAKVVEESDDMASARMRGV